MRQETRDRLVRNWRAVELAALRLVSQEGGHTAFTVPATVARVRFHSLLTIEPTAVLPQAESHPEAGADEDAPDTLLDYYYPAVLDLSDPIDHLCLLLHEGAHLFLLPRHGKSYPTNSISQHGVGWVERVLLLLHQTTGQRNKVDRSAFVADHLGKIPRDPEEVNRYLRWILTQTHGTRDLYGAKSDK